MLRGLLFGIGTSDARTLLAVAVVTALFAMTAAYVPGRRASRLDPTIALRAE
jgi:putative ABC transport system permease protein